MFSFARYDAPFILITYALCVSLSTIAAVSTGSPNISAHLSKNRLVVIMVDFLPDAFYADYSVKSLSEIYEFSK